MISCHTLQITHVSRIVNLFMSDFFYLTFVFFDNFSLPKFVFIFYFNPQFRNFLHKKKHDKKHTQKKKQKTKKNVQKKSNHFFLEIMGFLLLEFIDQMLTTLSIHFVVIQCITTILF